jgi:hypothetical protein
MVWEWDGGKDLVEDFVRFNQRWSELAFKDLQAKYDGIKQRSDTAKGSKPEANVVDVIVMAADLVTGFSTLATAKVLLLAQPTIGQAQDRPIGAGRDSIDATGSPAFTFRPQRIALTVSGAEKVLQTSPGSGVPTGIIAVRYVDDPSLKGDYTLYLQIERTR